MRIFPLGESALTIELGNEISIELNKRAIELCAHISAQAFPGMIEAVPAYSSVAVFFDPLAVGQAFARSPHSAVETIARERLASLTATLNEIGRTIEVPVRFDAESSPDLDLVCDFSGLSTEDAIDVFLGRIYKVFMLGFLPGFAYMGEVDDRIAAPRLSTPRTRVPAGSVGIAGDQTGIYPVSSPGGWNVIGRTDLSIFDRDATPPCLFRPGDAVRFVRS
ncbi:MAG: 5-oxoprolinase subunit PxpB [Pyrinomonadaceae bacterium]